MIFIVEYLCLITVAIGVGWFLGTAIAKMPRLAGISGIEPDRNSHGVIPACIRALRSEPQKPTIGMKSFAIDSTVWFLKTIDVSKTQMLVEVLSTSTVIAVYTMYGISFSGLVFAYLLLSLLMLGATDLKDRLLPDVLTIPLLIVGLIACYTNLWSSPFIDALMWVFVVFVFMKIVEFVSVHLVKKPMGGGDVKYAAALAAWFGQDMFSIIGAAAFVLLVFVKTTSYKGDELPFGTSLSCCSLLALVVIK